MSSDPNFRVSLPIGSEQSPFRVAGPDSAEDGAKSEAQCTTGPLSASARWCNSLKVDQNGRLKIPLTLSHYVRGTWQRVLRHSENGDFVRICSLRVWNDVKQRLGRLCLHNRNTQKLARVKYFGQAVTMDKQVLIRSSCGKVWK